VGFLAFPDVCRKEFFPLVNTFLALPLSRSPRTENYVPCLSWRTLPQSPPVVLNFLICAWKERSLESLHHIFFLYTKYLTCQTELFQNFLHLCPRCSLLIHPPGLCFSEPTLCLPQTICMPLACFGSSLIPPSANYPHSPCPGGPSRRHAGHEFGSDVSGLDLTPCLESKLPPAMGPP